MMKRPNKRPGSNPDVVSTSTGTSKGMGGISTQKPAPVDPNPKPANPSPDHNPPSPSPSKPTTNEQ